MDQQKRNSNLSENGDEFGETSESPPSTNSTYLSFNNLDTSQSIFEHNDLNQVSSDSGEYLYLRPMLNDQRCAVMALKMSEYEKSLAEKDHTIKSMHAHMMNSQNNNYVVTNQCTSIMEKTKPVNYTDLCQNTGFTNICGHLNKLWDTVENARTIQKDVMNLVDQTTKTFHEKYLNIDESLKQVSIEKTRAKQELETLDTKYSLDMIVYKSNLEECTKENENLKIENYWLLEKLNETNIILNEEKEIVLSFNQNHEKVLKEMEDQKVLLISQNKSLAVKYEEILNENQSLKDEISTIKISLDENKEHCDMQSIVIKEQTELLKKLKISEELNDTLKKDILSLKEQNEYLEKKHAILMEDISEFKLSHKEIQIEKEKKFKDIYKKYDELLKMRGEILIENNDKLQLQNEKECEIPAEEINLKQVVDVCNNTIFNLQEELKNYYILIPELQNKICDLSANLTNANQKLLDLYQENITEINKLNKEKSELENQSKEHINQIEKLTADLMKYESKANELHADVMRFRFQCTQPNQENTLQKPPTIETVDLLSDEDVNMEDDECSIVEFNGKDVTNMDVSMQSSSNKINQKYNYSSSKRNSSLLRLISNSKLKKRKTSVDNIASQISAVSTMGLKQNIDVYQIENSLNSSFKSINLKHEDKSIDGKKVDKKYDQDLHIKESKTPLKEKYEVNNERKKQVLKKIFKKPANKPFQVAGK